MEQRKRLKTLYGITIKQPTIPNATYVTVNEDKEHNLFEVFVTIGKEGSIVAGFAEALGRVISIALQYNVPEEEIIRQMKGIRAGQPFIVIDKFGREINEESMYSDPDAIAKAMEMVIKLRKKKKNDKKKL